MALVLADRVKESTTTAGTGTVTLLGAAPGFQSFAVVGDANTTYYTIAGQTTSEWEVGIGTYTSSGTTLARTTVLSNSAGTQPTALTFSAGTKDVFVTYPSSKSVNLDASGNATALGTPASFVGTNITGTASGLTAGNVTTNANLTGAVTSVGNAASLGSFTSSQLIGALTDETGTGVAVFATSPTLVTPVLGVATATSINKVALTAPATSATLTIANGKTLTASNTLTFTGTDASSVAFGAGGTVLYAVPNASTQVTSLGVGTAASGTTGEIRATNNITAYYSDDRFKTNLGNIPDALAKVLTLNGFYYEANELAQSFGYEKILEVGVSAQQVQAVQPEVVAPAPIDENYLTVRYERLVPLLIEAIKELNAKVTALEQVVAKSTQG
jgi:hypothetical protein